MLAPFYLDLLVAGGTKSYNPQSKLSSVELIDLDKDVKCELQESLPMPLYQAAGGVLHRNVLIICGGNKNSMEVFTGCLLSNAGFPQPILTLQEERTESAGIVIDKDTFFLAGGSR